jgi:hypothetical protein
MRYWRWIGQSAPPIIREPQTSFAQLFSKNEVFLSQVFDHLELALIHPSGSGDQ